MQNVGFFTRRLNYGYKPAHSPTLHKRKKITRARVPMVTNLLKAPPYTKENFTGARVPPSLRGQSKRNCPSSWPGYSLRATPRPSPWVGDGVWGVDNYGWCNRKWRNNTIYTVYQNKAADRCLIPQSRILRGTGNRERAKETKHLRKNTTTLPHA